MKVIIDRFEEDIAVVELNGEMLNVPRALFAEAQEGDAVELTVLPRGTAAPDASEKAADDSITPADATDDPAAKAEHLKTATMRLFGLDQPKDEEESDEDPAAMFKKLRNKKKRK